MDAPMPDFAYIEGRRSAFPAGTTLVGVIFILLGLPTGLFALASGLGLLPLPYQLFLVLQRTPIAFSLHMVASGLALLLILLLIPITVFVRDARRFHRVAGRMTAVCVVIGGATALPVALASEATVAARAGLFMQGLAWVALLVAAIAAIRRGNRALHARIMVAMVCVVSGAIWLRLVTAGAVEFNLPFDAAYAVGAWACWIVPLAIACVVTARITFGSPVSTIAHADEGK